MHLVIGIIRHQLLPVEVLHALMVNPCLRQIHLGQPHTGLGRTQLTHVRNHLHLRYDLT